MNDKNQTAEDINLVQKLKVIVKCRLREQGFETGSFLTFYEGEWKRACEATLKWKEGN